jgi:glycosyltransferase involved in cell wall biosynthesis
MIVRDEEPVIERALVSARPFISTWVIVDTGSTDQTMEIVNRVMGDMPGLLVERPWTNFGHNRSEALALCRGRMDWAVMMDADDTLEGVVPPAAVWTRTDIDCMLMTLHHDQMRHERVQVFRVAADWYYKGVLHEQALLRGRPAQVARLPAETYMVTRCEGVRSRDPQKYQNDAAVLLREIESGDSDPRTLFYLAQSYRDAGMKAEAVNRYYEYLDASGAVQQEQYLAILSLLTLVDDPEERTKLAWRGIELVPTRLEVPFAYLSRWRTERRKMGLQQFAIGSVLQGRKPAEGDIYVNPQVYEWGLDNELMGAAAEIGRWSVVRDTAMRCAVYMPEAAMREAAIQRVRMASERL